MVADVDPVDGKGGALTPDAVFDGGILGVEAGDWLRLSEDAVKGIEVEAAARDETSERDVGVALSPVPVEGVEDGEGAESKRHVFGEDELVVASMVEGEIAELGTHARTSDAIDLLIVEEIADGAAGLVVGDRNLVELIGSASSDRDDLGVGCILVESAASTWSTKGQAFVDDEDALVGEEEVGHLPSAEADGIVELLESDGIDAAGAKSIVLLGELDSTGVERGDVGEIEIDVARNASRIDELSGVAGVLLGGRIADKHSVFTQVGEELDVIEATVGIGSAARRGDGGGEGERLDVEVARVKVDI